MITRRWVLRAATGGAAFAALGAFSALAVPLVPASRRAMIQRVIYYYAPGIVFDGDDLTVFADYIHRTVLGRKLQGLRRLGYYTGTFLLYHSASTRDLVRASPDVLDIDQRIMDAFFLCTDFFEDPVTPGRRISLERSPDPYESGCSNPLATTFNGPVDKDEGAWDKDEGAWLQAPPDHPAPQMTQLGTSRRP
jgi:hypothetical protein